MKNLVLAASIALATVSCKQSENKPAQTVKEKSVQKNEMVALMDQMMDEMHGHESTQNNDADFAKMMIDHHKGAVDMSEILLQKGQNQELKNFAQKVIDAQNKEIALMEKFTHRKEVSPDTKQFQRELHGSMGAMMNKNIKIHDNLDKDYAEQMIPHHQSAVDMAKVYLKHGKEKELINLCNDIVKTQTAEISQLQTWLSKT